MVSPAWRLEEWASFEPDPAKGPEQAPTMEWEQDDAERAGLTEAMVFKLATFNLGLSAGFRGRLLQLAVRYNNEGVARALVRLGADVCVQAWWVLPGGKAILRPLHAAAASGHLGIVR